MIWPDRLALLSACIGKASEARTISDFGGFTWLSAFDDDDLRTFLEELEDLLVVSSVEQATQVLDGAVAQWRITAEQLDDPLRRSILLGSPEDDDFVEVRHPE